MKLVLIFFLLSANVAYSYDSIEETPKVETNVAAPETKEIEIKNDNTAVPELAKKHDSQYYRDESFGTLMFSYQPVTTWVPAKKAISYTQIFSRDWTLEFEYAWSTISFPVFGIDVGEITEKRYGLQCRKY